MTLKGKPIKINVKETKVNTSYSKGSPWKHHFLHCDSSNLGYLDKVDQLDFTKMTTHSKKADCGPISSL